MLQEIETVEALAEHLARGGSLRGLVIQGLDLTGLSELLRRADGEGAVLLGCRLEPEAVEALRRRGALLFPPLPDLPYHPYRPSLYTPEELLDGYEPGRPESFFESTLDARIYRHYRESRPPTIVESLARRLHDFSIDDAMGDLLAQPVAARPVAIMGGHAMRRDDPTFAKVAAIAQRLCRAGYFLISGGGPGAMEATNLGAWLGDRDDDAVPAAVAMLGEAPTYRDPGWIESALAVKAAFPEGRPSLGVPTWFYGHEPSNLFATHVAKYFSNSLREDGLLAIATHGVVYAPGSAGTIQEVFMDAAQNHYRTFGCVSPMVFFGARYWREDKPVKPVLDAIGGDRAWLGHVGYCDTPAEVVAFIEAHPPA